MPGKSRGGVAGRRGQQRISLILKGSVHDVKAFDTHETLGRLNVREIVADKGDIGRGLHAQPESNPDEN